MRGSAGFASILSENGYFRPTRGWTPTRRVPADPTGQGGHGIQTAPPMAILAAALVRRMPVPERLLNFGLDARAPWPERVRNLRLP